MRRRMLLLMIGVMLTVIAVAQDAPVGVVVAFKRGSSVELAKYLSDNVELIILNRTSNSDKATAEATMHAFFMQNEVSSFNVNHQGRRGESSFVIGTLNTSTGNYRVNCFLKRNQSKYLVHSIHQIRIDKANE